MLDRLKYFFQVAVLTFLIIGCVKDEEPAVEGPTCVIDEEHIFSDTSFMIGLRGLQEGGVASAQKNGVHWEGSLQAIKSKLTGELYVSLFTYPDTFYIYPWESLTFGSMPYAEGCNELCKSNCPDSNYVRASYMTNISIDQRGDVYDVLQQDDLPNFMEVVRLEGDSIFGKFSITYEMDLTKSLNNHDNPQVVRYYNGDFRGIIIER